jgi:hypothetical protein
MGNFLMSLSFGSGILAKPAKRTVPGHLLAAEDSQERGEVCVCAEL